MTHEDTAIDSAPMPVLTEVGPRIEILGTYTFLPGQSLEPWAAETVVLKHTNPPKVKPHPGSTALYKLPRNWRLRTIIHDRVLRISPYLRNTALTLSPIQTTDARILRMSIHLFDELNKSVSRGDVVVFDRKDILPGRELRMGEDCFYRVVIRVSDFLPQRQHTVDCLIGRKDK